MTERAKFIRHVFGGGFASNFSTEAETNFIDEGTVVIPYLVDAENVTYDLDGGPLRAPGTAKLNSTVLESGVAIKGVFDCWFSGTAGSSTQHRIIHIGTVIKKDDADGTFTDLFTGLESGKVPSYVMLEDLLIMASDSNTDVPKSWDGTTAQNLAGSPPNFAFAEEHNNRVWAAGVATAPSRLYYSASLNPEDWAGKGSGFIDISPSDGDVITGIASHKDQLFVFKGPYKGSIHVISGTSPANFTRDTFIRGIGAAGHNSIFRYKDDLGYVWSDGSINSLSATASHGDFTQGALSYPISKWIRENVNLAQIKNFHAVNNEEFGIILFSLAIGASSTNNYTLAMDYRFPQPRWALWPAYISASLTSVVDPTDSNRRIIMAGGQDGFVRKYNQSNTDIDGITTIFHRITTPSLNYDNAIQMKLISAASVSLVRKNDVSLVFGWARDGSAQQTTTFTQSSSSVLDSFVLGTDVLVGGALISDLFTDLPEGGEFRSIQYQLSDADVHSFGVVLEGLGWSIE